MAKKKAKFFSPRTAGFVKRLTKEYVNRMNQEILYYPVNAERSDTGDLYSQHYNESSKKQMGEGILVPCNVFIQEKNTENFKDAGFELRTFIDVFFHMYDLEELNIVPEIGDIISFQNAFFEIFDTDDHQMLHGDPEYKYGFTVNCMDMRINNYQEQLETDIKFKQRMRREDENFNQ